MIVFKIKTIPSNYYLNNTISDCNSVLLTFVPINELFKNKHCIDHIIQIKKRGIKM